MIGFGCRSTRGRDKPPAAGVTDPAAFFLSLAVNTTAAILAHVRRLGYIVKEFRFNGTVEFHAVPLDGSPPQVVRCNDGEDDEAAYRAACLLAAAAEIALDE